MGQDWIPKVGKSIERRLDRALVELFQPDLFTQQPQSAARIAAATLECDSKVHEGERLVAHRNADRIDLHRGIQIVATIHAPSSDQLDALSGCPAMAEVCAILPFSNVVEVKLS